MAIRNLGNTLETSLLNNDVFNYAHLVKFEKPTTEMVRGKTSQKADTYSYITEGSFDIVWDDGSVDGEGNLNGPQTYIANKLGKIGSVTESTEARASSVSITLDTASLGSSATVNSLKFQSTTLTGPYGTNFVEAGFREGDKVLITSSNSGAPNINKYLTITTFKEDGKAFNFTTSDTLSTSANFQVHPYVVSLASEELNALLLNKTSTAYTTYLNREVFIHKAHMDIDTNQIIGATAQLTGGAYLVFKGIITNGAIKEKPDKSSSITWTLSSHWGDFARVSGRLTIDESHRALDGTGQPDLDAVVRPEYAGDLGFAHANQSLNVMALYNDIEISYKQVDINGGWFGGKRLREVETEVERRTDLAFNLSPKYLPVVYGVQKIDAIPVFVDTSNTNAAEIFVAYAMCEGPVGGLLDLYIDNNSSICIDKADSDLRSSAGDTVDLVCKGRADRGNTLTGYNANSGNAANIASGMDDYWREYGRSFGRTGRSAGSFHRPEVQSYSVNATAADSQTGILHEQTHTITSPLTGHFQFHSGLADQKANPTLVSKAAGNGFKIQNDYFEGKSDEYWNTNHQLLDTAYTVGKFTIAAGETSIPEIDFVVRGKGVQTFNYDRTYNNTNQTSSAKTNFNLGDTVLIKKSSDNSTIVGVKADGTNLTSGTQTIIDKWDFLDVDGVTQTRIRTDFDADITVAHYLVRTSNSSLKWYMAPDISTEDITALVVTPSKTTLSSSSANSSSGVDVVVANNAAFRAAIAAAIAAGDLFGNLAFSGTTRRDLENGRFLDFSWNPSSNTVASLGSGSAVSSLDSSITEVFVKDAIILNNSHSEADGHYIGQNITLKRFDSDGVPHIQERTIVAYANTGNVAVVNQPWVAGFFPDAGDTYVISRGKPDVRVTINPAMQLLDYLTNERYGRGLDLVKDIDLSSFKQAARDCDTRSDVTVVATNGNTVNVGDIYQYAPSGVVLFRGTVASVTSRTLTAETAGSFVIGRQYTIVSVGSTNFTSIGASSNTVGVTFTATGIGSNNGTASNISKEIEFTNVIGKLARKWNNWETFAPNQIIWDNEYLWLMSSSGGVQSTVPSASSSYQSTSTAFTLSKFSGNAGSTANLNLDLSHASDNGNPVVKSFVQNTFEASGYSLYDSDDIKYWKYIGWDSNGQRNVTRHQMNQTVTTSNPIFDNINLMLKQFNGVLRYSNGEYQLVVKGQTPSVFVNGEVLYESDIIGDISLKDAGVKKSYNSVSSSIKDPQAKFESRSVNFFNSDYLKQDKFIPKKGNYGMPGVTNYFNARFNVNQYLDESRYGLTVSFKMMPKGILLQPGSIIKLNYPRFGWENKEFRINSLTMNSDCLVQVTADEHNNSAFLIKKVSKPSVGTEVATATPVNINTPAAPTNLAGAGKVPGTFVLTWDNATDFDLDTHTTEVYANTTHNDKDHANTKLIAKGLQVERYDHTVEADTANTTQYFWVKHVVVRTNKLGSRDIRSLFAPNTTAGVSTVAPIRHKGKWNIAVSSLPTSAALSNARWGDGTGERPDTLVAGDEAWFFTGNQNAPSGQKIWQYTGSTWTEITQAIRGDVMVDGTVTTTEIADGTILADNIDQTASAGKFGEVVAALGTFTQVDTDVLNANSVIAREVQVFPSGGTPPTISGTTLAGAGIDLKQDGDMYVGNAAANKYMFWDQSAGTMTFRGTLNVDDITGSSAKFSTLMAEVATIGTLNTEMLDSDAIVTRDIRVGPSVETNAGSFATGTEYYITVLGNTTQAQWNSVAGTSGVVYNLGSIFTAANAGTGTGKARNRTTVAKIAGATLTGTGAHLNSDGDFYVGNASTNKYMFWDQSAGTMQIRGALNADDITAGNITASNINVTNLAALSANLGNVTAGTLKGGTIPEASSAPTSTESGTFFDLTGGRMVLGNANKYIWWNGTNLEINGVTISDATLSGSTGFATETFVTTAINNLVDNAPAALNTLNEIAAALDDDASFHSSVTTSLSNKVGTTSAQALTSAANAMTISGSTISLVRANGDTDTVAVPNDNTQYTAGSGLALSGTTFSNSAPDRTVSLTGSGATSVSGTYPNFTITSTNSNTQRSDEEIRDLAAGILTAGTNVSISVNDAANTATISSTDTNTQYTAGSGLSLSGTTFSNSAPDRTVALTAGSNISVSGTYPNFSISSTNTNTQRTDEEIRDLAASIITAGTNVSVVKNDAADTVTISSTDTNTQYSAGSGLSLSGTTFTNSSPDRTVTLTGAGTTSVSGSYPDFTITSNADSGNASQLGGQSASHYLNVNTTFGGDVSGKYNAIVIADDSHNHTITNVDGLQTALNGKVDDNQVLTNVPTGALFTDTNTNYFLNGISKSGNTLTFSVSGSTNQSFAFGANAFTSHSAPHYTSAIVSSDVTGALGFTPGTSSLALGTSSSTALAGNTSIPQGDITAITVSAPITGGGTTGSVGIGITQASGSANGYLSSTDWTTFNNKSTFNGAYSSLSGRPTLFDGAYGSLSGRPTIPVDLTGANAGTVHATNYINTQYVAATSSAFGLVKIGYSENGKNYPVELSSGKMYVNVPWTDANDNTITSVGISGSQTTGTITLVGNSATSLSQSGNTITISSVNTNTEYTANNGVQLSGTVFSHVDTSSQASVNNSGRNYIQDITLDTFGHITGITSTSVPSELSTSGNTNIELDPGGSGVVIFKGNSTKGAGQFKLNCEANTHGITIKGPPHSAGASYTLTLPNNDGNANQVLKTDGSGVTSWVAQSSSGVSTIQAGSGVNGIIVANGTTATATLSVHATLEGIADGVAVSNLDVDFLKADTIVANKIDANEITMNKLKTAPVSGQGSVEIGTAGIRILDSSSVLRVAIGNLSRLATNHNNA